jgi:hypothetical protein
MKQEENQGYILDLSFLFIIAPVSSTLSLYLTLSLSICFVKV